MRSRWLCIACILSGVGLLTVGCAQAAPTEAPPAAGPTEPAAQPPPTEIAITGSLSVGGKLYDKWWEQAEVDQPTGDQPLWATQTTNTRSGLDTWRCKECHGWDYKGADGAYGSGSHFTGFPGVLASAPGMGQAQLLAWLDGTANPDHDFAAMGQEAMFNLVVFLEQGLIDVGPYIDAETKAPIGGDAGAGQEQYEQACTACHGPDGRAVNFGDAEKPEFVATIALDNPWEFIHKVRLGQPGAPMPAAVDSGWNMQDVVNLLAYAQTLSSEPAVGGSVPRGGRLYDKWWEEAGIAGPTGDSPLWARQTSNTRSGPDTWRCKECHGWDYRGAEGAYGSGSHFTGFPGVLEAPSQSVEELMAQLGGAADPEHDFSALGETDLLDLASFLKEGLIEVAAYIDAQTKATIGGDAATGQELYSATCAACHGEDGKTINFGDAAEPEYLGTIAADNPWEFIHKVRMGQPGTQMPAALELGWHLDEVIDVLTYAQTLPIE